MELRLGWLVVGVLALSVWIAPAARAVPVVTFVMTGGGAMGPITVPVSTNPDGISEISGFTMTNPGFNPDNLSDPANEWSITLSASLDPDPQIIYAASVIDFGAPTTFGFVFSQAIVPTPAPGLVTHSHSSSTTDGGADGVSVTAAAPPAGIVVDSDGNPEIAVYNLSQNSGASFLSAQLDLSPSFAAGTGSQTQGPFNPATIAGPAGAGSYDLMRVDVNSSMNGGNDAYTFNGIATVVPEPGTGALLALGLLALALPRRR